jgi:hypothetical protein
MLFLGLQAAQVAVRSAGTDVEQAARWRDVPPALYEFSADRNVIHLVLDEFQSDLFGELAERDRGAFDRSFAGFVYFADHLGAFPTTSLAMPAMLTGREYRNQEPVPAFVRSAFSEASLFARVSRAGFQIDAASILSGDWTRYWFAAEDGRSPLDDGARFTIRKPFVSQWDYRQFTGRQLIEYSLARHAPHSLKVTLAEHPAWFDRLFGGVTSGSAEVTARRHEAANSKAFLEDVIRNSVAVPGRPRYKLLHLGMPHRPTVLDADCRYLGETRFSRQAYLGQSACTIALVSDFLDRLRSLGVYDSSLIIVSSDHGTDLKPREFSGKSGSLPLVRGASTAGLHAIAGTAHALMLIKPPGRTGPLAVSEAPTAHVDVPATVLDLLGLGGDEQTESMFRRDATRPRRRVYGMYDVSQRFPRGYLSRLDLLSIDGRLTEGRGWHLERSILNPGTRLSAQAIDVGTPEAATQLGPGWSPSHRESADGSGEVTYAWGLGDQAVTLVSLSPGATRFVARLAVPASSSLKGIGVELDGRVLDRWVPAGRGYHDYAAAIPPDPARPAVSVLVLRFESTPSNDLAAKVDRLSFETD